MGIILLFRKTETEFQIIPKPIQSGWDIMGFKSPGLEIFGKKEFSSIIQNSDNLKAYISILGHPLFCVGISILYGYPGFDLS